MKSNQIYIGILGMTISGFKRVKKKFPIENYITFLFVKVNAMRIVHFRKMQVLLPMRISAWNDQAGKVVVMKVHMNIMQNKHCNKSSNVSVIHCTFLYEWISSI